MLNVNLFLRWNASGKPSLVMECTVREKGEHAQYLFLEVNSYPRAKLSKTASFEKQITSNNKYRSNLLRRMDIREIVFPTRTV